MVFELGDFLGFLLGVVEGEDGDGFDVDGLVVSMLL